MFFYTGNVFSYMLIPAFNNDSYIGIELFHLKPLSGTKFLLIHNVNRRSVIWEFVIISCHWHGTIYGPLQCYLLPCTVIYDEYTRLPSVSFIITLCSFSKFGSATFLSCSWLWPHLCWTISFCSSFLFCLISFFLKGRFWNHSFLLLRSML